MKFHSPEQEPFPPEKKPPFWPGEPSPEKTGERPVQPDVPGNDPGRSGIPPTRSAVEAPDPVPPLPPSDDPGAPPQDPTVPPDPLHPPGAPVIEPPGPKPRRLGMRVMPTDELDFFLSRDAISALRTPHRGWARMLRSH
jgi:hypothetical protein